MSIPQFLPSTLSPSDSAETPQDAGEQPAPCLSPYVFDILIRHLKTWTIGETLYYDDRARLRRRPWWQSPAFHRETGPDRSVVEL